MSHLIIDRKSREFIQTLATSNLEMEDVHNSFDSMVASEQKDDAEALIDDFGIWLHDQQAEYESRFAAIKSAVGL